MKIRRGLLTDDFQKSSGIIKKIARNPIQPGNPYRTILRRDHPEPFIAMLAFILGIWLWDHYFGKDVGYEPGTEEIALVKIDRDLRLADAMAEDPPWLRKLAGVGEPVVVRREALEALDKLAEAKAISTAGLEAFAVVKSEQDGLPLQEMLGQVLQGQMISDFEQASKDLANHGGTWWQAKLIESWEENVVPRAHWRHAYGEDLLQLKTRAVVSGSAVLLLGVAGLAFIPNALRCVKAGLSIKPKGYGGAWSMPLGLVVFLLTTLAWIGFSMSLELGIGALPQLHPAMWIGLDSAARVLPALIALGLLFRKPSHVIRVMGLRRPVPLKVILGMFSLLMVVDYLLRLAMGDAGSADPGGGLSLGDAGWWGLAFAMISACLLAPVAEETLYRGVLFGSCRNQLGVLPAALLSSAVFAIIHFYDGYGLASVGVFGFSCALLYSGTGSLTTVIVLHMLYNMSIKIPEWIVYHAPLG